MSRAPAGWHALDLHEGSFAELIGPLYLHQHEGRVKMGFRVEARHTNPLGICHGGMLASFCDMLLPVSIHRLHPDIAERFLPTVSLQLDYLAAVAQGAWVEGETQVLRKTRGLVFAQAVVLADAVPAVRVSGVFKIGGPFPPAQKGTK